MGSVSEIDGKQEEKELKFRLHKFLLEKYAETINKEENKTIGEIKGLVDPDDLSIQSLLAELISTNYSFEKNFSINVIGSWTFGIHSLTCGLT